MNTSSTQINSTEIIRKLFPESVTGVILPIDDYQSHLHPDEAKIISTASVKRKLEFSTARWCAKQALASEGIQDFPILSGENREPVWPKGFIGSISHCKDQCSAVIAKKSDINSIGFDVEKLKKLKTDIAKAICTDAERDWLSKQSKHFYDNLVLTIFSLKESVYKCVFQHQQVQLGFKDCSITPNINERTANIIFHRQVISPDIKLNFLISGSHIYSSAIYL